MAHLTIHDATVELYDSIDVREDGGETTFWKTLYTPTMRITFFRPLDWPADRQPLKLQAPL